MASKLKKGDTVQIMVGKDRGLRGKIVSLDWSKGQVVVEERNMVKKHQKAGQNQEAGINEQEAPLKISNVMVIDPTDDKPTRVGFKTENGIKQRVSKRTGKALD